MGDQVLRLLRKRGAGADEVVGFAGVGDKVVGLDGDREGSVPNGGVRVVE